MRELFNLDIKKLKEEDRRFLLQKNSSEILHYDQQLMNNKILMIALFALFASLISVILSIGIPNISKIIFALIIIIFTIYLVKTFNDSRDIISEDKNRMVKISSDLFKLHFDYAKKRGG